MSDEKPFCVIGVKAVHPGESTQGATCGKAVFAIVPLGVAPGAVAAVCEAHLVSLLREATGYQGPWPKDRGP